MICGAPNAVLEGPRQQRDLPELVAIPRLRAAVCQKPLLLHLGRGPHWVSVQKCSCALN